MTMKKIVAYTDYPFISLGDVGGQTAPIREVTVICFDGERYCRVWVEGIVDEVKAGYLYTTRCRFDDVEAGTAFNVSLDELKKLPGPNAWLDWVNENPNDLISRYINTNSNLKEP